MKISWDEVIHGLAYVVAAAMIAAFPGENTLLGWLMIGFLTGAGFEKIRSLVTRQIKGGP